MSDQDVIEIWRRYERLQREEEAIYPRFNAAERRGDKAEIAACRRHWHRLCRKEDEIVRLAVATPSTSIVGIGYKLSLWRQESAQTGFGNPDDVFAFAAYRDAINLADLPELRHKKDRRELAHARRWTCKIS